MRSFPVSDAPEKGGKEKNKSEVFQSHGNMKIARVPFSTLIMGDMEITRHLHCRGVLRENAPVLFLFWPRSDSVVCRGYVRARVRKGKEEKEDVARGTIVCDAATPSAHYEKPVLRDLHAVSRL